MNKLQAFLDSLHPETIHEDVLRLLVMYLQQHPGQLPEVLTHMGTLAAATLVAKDQTAGQLHQALGYSCSHIPDSAGWKRLGPREKAIHGALIFKPLMPEGSPTMHAPAEVDAFNAFREALIQVADALVDSDWATQVVPGMNEWLKKVLEG